MSDTKQGDPQVLTDGFDLYIRLRRGKYARVSRRGTRMGRRLEHLRIRGEWFANTPELRKVISRRRGRGANKKIDEATGALPS